MATYTGAARRSVERSERPKGSSVGRLPPMRCRDERRARKPLSFRALCMEPAGVEPASANRSLSASTCVVRFSLFSLARRQDGRPLTSQPRPATAGVSLPAPWHRRRASPIQSSSPAGPRARSLLKTGYSKLMLTQPAPCCCWHLMVFPLFYEVTDTSARSADFTKHVESVSAPDPGV